MFFETENDGNQIASQAGSMETSIQQVITNNSESARNALFSEFNQIQQDTKSDPNLITELQLQLQSDKSANQHLPAIVLDNDSELPDMGDGHPLLFTATESVASAEPGSDKSGQLLIGYSDEGFQKMFMSTQAIGQIENSGLWARESLSAPWQYQSWGNNP